MDLNIMKITKYLLLTAFAATGILLTGCSNPADNTESATVADAVDAVKSVANASIYSIHSDSTISFVGSKVTGSHDGGFKSFEGEIAVANGKIVAPSKITIQMDSLWSDNDRLTGHLKNADFFDTANIPTAEFAVTSMRDTPQGPELTGNLTLHGVTKSISFKPEVSISDSEVTLKAEFDIMRFDFDIVYKGKADDLIRDEVVIKLDVKATSAG
jgi:polyisoprenoid-binding protein YceI